MWNTGIVEMNINGFKNVNSIGIYFLSFNELEI
jgi:hypothetical protein